MKLIRFKPTVPAFNHGSLLDELDRLFEAGFPAIGRGPGFGAFPVDVYQDNDAVFVRAELPGFRKEDLRVDVAADILTITAHAKAGDKKGEDASKTETSVERAIALPENLNYDKVTAAYENGLLIVTLPKREETKPKTVAVEVK